MVVIVALAIAGLGVDQRLHRTDIKVQGTAGARADAQAARYFGDSQTLVVLLEGPRAAIDQQGPGLAARLDAKPGLAVLGPWAPDTSSGLRPARDKALLLVRADRDFETVSRRIVPA